MKKPPRYLYKYMNKRLDRIGDVLVNRRLHFADPVRFNDPFDCALGLDLRRGATIQNWEDYFSHLVEVEEPKSTPEDRQAKAEDNVRRGRHTDPAFVDEAEKGIRRAVKEVGREQGVLSLSSDPRNVMMWAHYAANHEGLVLRFDTRHMGDQASGELRCFRVEYGLSFPRLPDYLTALRTFENGDMRAFAELYFCRKSRDWKYENEWRFFAGKPDTFVVFEPPMLSGVIFGWKMPESTRQMVASWTTALATPPKLFQAEPCPDRFRMKITKMPMGAQPSH
ncbi:MAG TPA: hypothetical protein DCF93_10220 [Desulfuromonas sp.]|nr:hypothetical protein [Desulfuromonas sp.]